MSGLRGVPSSEEQFSADRGLALQGETWTRNTTLLCLVMHIQLTTSLHIELRHCTMRSPRLLLFAKLQPYFGAGTGLKECIISGLLSVDGLKVRRSTHCL